MKSVHYLFVITLLFLFFTHVEAQDQQVFKIVEKMPFYGSCDNIVNKTECKNCSDKAIYQFFAEQIIYPDAAIEQKTDGTVVLKCVINEQGDIQNAIVVRDLPNGCGAEALRVLNTMGKWTAGQQNNKDVAVEVYLPIKFKIKNIIIQTEKFVTLNDLFCADYLTDFVKKEVLNDMATQTLDKKNICSVSTMQNGLGSLKLSLIKNQQVLSTAENLNGEFTSDMKAILEKAQVGDVIAFDFEYIIDFNGQDFVETKYKSIIVE